MLQLSSITSATSNVNLLRHNVEVQEELKRHANITYKLRKSFNVMNIHFKCGRIDADQHFSGRCSYSHFFDLFMNECIYI